MGMCNVIGHIKSGFTITTPFAISILATMAMVIGSSLLDGSLSVSWDRLHWSNNSFINTILFVGDGLTSIC